MRVFVTWLLALGMIVSPAMAGTDRPGDGKDTTSKAGNSSATTEKDKTADTTSNAANASKTNAAATPSSLENEIQQLRELIESQSKLLQAQSEQLKEQQHRMQLLESEVSSSSNASPGATRTRAPCRRGSNRTCPGDCAEPDRSA